MTIEEARGRVARWIETYEKNGFRGDDRIGASYESAPLFLSDLRALIEPPADDGPGWNSSPDAERAEVRRLLEEHSAHARCGECAEWPARTSDDDHRRRGAGGSERRGWSTCGRAEFGVLGQRSRDSNAGRFGSYEGCIVAGRIVPFGDNAKDISQQRSENGRRNRLVG